MLRKVQLVAALALFASLLAAEFVTVRRTGPAKLRAAKHVAHAKGVPVMAAALGSGASMLVTHNVRHFTATKTLRVVRPRDFLEEARAWMARFNP